MVQKQVGSRGGWGGSVGRGLGLQRVGSRTGWVRSGSGREVRKGQQSIKSEKRQVARGSGPERSSSKKNKHIIIELDAKPDKKNL